MSAPFLRAGGVVLSAYELSDARAGASLPPRLLPAARSGGADRIVAFAARAAEDERFLGRAALEGVDWIARRARVTARWGPDPALAPEVLRLVARYAWTDLNLDALEAEPADEAWRGVLREAGFAQAPVQIQPTVGAETRVLWYTARSPGHAPSSRS